MNNEKTDLQYLSECIQILQDKKNEIDVKTRTTCNYTDNEPKEDLWEKMTLEALEI